MRRRRRSSKLSGVSKGEGSDSAQPRRSHRCEGGERRTPFAGCGAANEDLRVWWEAPVARPQVEDVHGGLLACDQTRVSQQTTAGQVACEKGIEGPGLQRKASNEHVVRSLGGGRDRRAGGVRDRDGIELEASLKCLDGVVYRCMDHGKVEYSGWTGTRGRGCEDPPFVAGSFENGYDESLNTIKGRFWYAQLKKRF